MHNQPRRTKRVLFIGEHPIKSAPSLTLARALEQSTAFECKFSDRVEYRSTKEWIRLCRQADVGIVVSYWRCNSFFLRQLRLAKACGMPIIRWWVGSDVLNNLSDNQSASDSRKLAQIADIQIAVSPHLVEELQTLHIEAKYIPSLFESFKNGSSTRFVPKSLLVYLPDNRRDFYGGRNIEQAVAENPDLKFIIVADDKHVLAKYHNVESLGWCSDMNMVWNQVGGLLRITEHDGMPRMVLDALSKEKWVIYSWPLEGCDLAASPDEIRTALYKFRGKTAPNIDGPSIVREIMNPDPVDRWTGEIDECITGLRWWHRVIAMNMRA